MHVEHFMTKNPVACEATDSMAHVAQLMRDKGVGAVVVLRAGKVAGMVTDRQLAMGGLAEGLAMETPVDQVMSENPARLTLDDNVFSAIDSMRSAGVVRRVPVVNEANELLGTVSVSDLAVIAKDLIDAILLEDSHHATSDAKILTGARRIVKEMPRPKKGDRRLAEQEIQAVTTGTPLGTPAGGSGGPRRE